MFSFELKGLDRINRIYWIPVSPFPDEREKGRYEAPGAIAGVKVIWSMAMVGRHLFALHPAERKIMSAPGDKVSRGLSCQSC